MNLKNLSLFAGFFFATLAIFTQGVLPMLEPESRQLKITKVVRTDLGELKWMEDDATNYSESELLGRKVYIHMVANFGKRNLIDLWNHTSHFYLVFP